ncbi:molecular chaperone TorD [Halodesulfurarchaeum formicicum]|uniref:Molecular chaperone TorD n=1 Tax=Halodesulfurarchaeum formicicum TaxID=1873524 RepID=A0A1D8S5X1_9EURY|nr:molecular chaperone TorD family protein [Halodesulfurarchaeum formicicum]AOW80744.1 molecular chaperone TorD [Halodesulfurarchaeum formicicum]APE96080.1 molecular chaperone TorD [Halodesulfurarchaeum formicicum]
MSTEDTDDATMAQLYDLLAGVFADPPDEETVAALASGPLPDPGVAPNDRLAAGLEGLDAWGETVEDPAAEADRLASEFTRLFIGPRPKLQIHESYYAGDYLGEPLAAVKETYQALGIASAPDRKEEADHAAVELAVLRELTATDGDRTAPFLREHGDWFDDLAQDIHEQTDEPFYEAIADLVAGVVAFDASRQGVRQ